MPYIEKESEKIFYTIGEVAELFQVNTSLIRFWEGEFSQLKPKKNKKGNRLFTPADVKNIKLIYHLVKEKGYTLEGAKKALQEDISALNKTLKIKEKLQSIKNALLALQKEVG